VKQEPLKKDITKQEGTYTKEILDNMSYLNQLGEDLSIDVNTYKTEVLKVIEKAHNTPAKARFINNLNQKTSKEAAMYVVYNAYLAGAGLAVIK